VVLCGPCLFVQDNNGLGGREKLTIAATVEQTGLVNCREIFLSSVGKFEGLSSGDERQATSGAQPTRPGS
jgi:hypothetical protein